MAASYPKPDNQKRNRNEPAFGWSDLPAAGREGEPPSLPPRSEDARDWLDVTIEAWADLWKSPQATMWDPSGRTLRSWAVCFDDLAQCQKDRKPVPASLLNEMRQVEDRHGLSPKAMLQLRWRIVTEDSSAVPVRTSKDRKSSVLKVLEGGG